MFLLDRFADLPAYVPGEHEENCMRLNTNESPFPPSPGVRQAIAGEVDSLQYYNDPDCAQLCAALAGLCGVRPEQVMATNGSDEALYFVFMAYGDAAHPIALPDVTYGYYDLFAAALGIPLRRVPLCQDFSVDYRDYLACGAHVVLANPNAPTGLAIPVAQLREIALSNPAHMLVVDEAYVDFGSQSAQPLIEELENVLIVRTFSKYGSLAGARLGYVLGCPARIAELQRLRNAVNLYSVNRMTQAAGVAACREDAYYRANCRLIMQAREETTRGLRALGFEVLPSLGNFVFARSSDMDAGLLQRALRARGILVRHWNAPRIAQWLRITIGTQAQMQALLAAIAEIREEGAARA